LLVTARNHPKILTAIENKDFTNRHQHNKELSPDQTAEVIEDKEEGRKSQGEGGTSGAVLADATVVADNETPFATKLHLNDRGSPRHTTRWRHILEDSSQSSRM
jgi:hypothetical protein